MATAMEPYVPIEDLALHFAVSVSTVRAWVRQGYIPKECYIKVGMTYRFKVSQVEQALAKAPDPMTMPIQSLHPQHTEETKQEAEQGVSKKPQSNLDLNADDDA